MGKRFGAAAGALYCLSLALPALAIVQQPLLWGSARDEVLYGGHCLLLGVFVAPAWLTNPFMFLAAIFYALGESRPGLARAAMWLAGFAVIAAVASPFVVHAMEILRYLHAGYYVWLASSVCLLLATISRVHDLSK